VYDLIITALKDGNNVTWTDTLKSKVCLSAYRRLKTGRYSCSLHHNPMTGKEEWLLLESSTGLIVPKESQVPDIVEKFYKENKGSGAKTVSKKIGCLYTGLGEKVVRKQLNLIDCHYKRKPSFKNDAPLRSIQAKQPMERCQVDLVDLSNIPVTIDDKTFKYCMSLIYIFSRFVWIRPLQTKSADDVANELYPIFMEYGPPRILQSDQGGEFKSVVNTLCKMLNVKVIHSSAYNPQAQGKVRQLK
jgi:hypothetical protein